MGFTKDSLYSKIKPDVKGKCRYFCGDENCKECDKLNFNKCLTCNDKYEVEEDTGKCIEEKDTTSSGGNGGGDEEGSSSIIKVALLAVLIFQVILF